MSAHTRAASTVITCDGDQCAAEFVRRDGDGGLWTFFALRLLARAMHRWDTAPDHIARVADSDDFCPRHGRRPRTGCRP